MYFNHFLYNKRSQDLLFSLLAPKDEKTLNVATMNEELKDAVQ